MQASPSTYVLNGSRSKPLKLTASIRMFARQISFHFTTMYLYMATDIKTVIIPVNVFALALTPRPSLSAFLGAQLWLALHLLQTDVSNQTFSGAEDALNRPWRPLPSGRVTVSQSRRFRWVLLALCFLVSAPYGPWALCASASLSTILVLHDDHDWSKQIFLKNLSNTIGYGTFETGTALIMSSQTTLDPRALIAVACSTGIVLSTIFAQDFSDVVGDAKYGRRTVPIIFPRASRFCIALMLPIWSFFLMIIWNTSQPLVALLYAGLGGYVGLRYLIYKSIPSDALSYRIYNVWLVASHLLPLGSIASRDGILNSLSRLIIK